MAMRRNNVFYTSYLLLFLWAGNFFAQKDAQALYDGNNAYNSGRVMESTTKYARALEINPNNRKANFNLGDAIYKNAQMIKSGKMSIPPGNNITPDSLSKLMFTKAADNFAVVANSVSNKDTLHRAWHNMGNCYLQQKNYEQAVTAYKKAPKFDPKDEETRYNLAYALKNMPKKKNNGGGGGQNKPQPKKEKQDKKDDDQKNGEQQQASKMSKEQAEQLLKTLTESEKKLQDKRKQKPENANRDDQKDW